MHRQFIESILLMEVDAKFPSIQGKVNIIFKIYREFSDFLYSGIKVKNILSITKQHYMACSIDLSDKKIQSELQISDGDSVGWCISTKNEYTACHPKDGY